MTCDTHRSMHRRVHSLFCCFAVLLFHRSRLGHSGEKTFWRRETLEREAGILSFLFATNQKNSHTSSFLFFFCLPQLKRIGDLWRVCWRPQGLLWRHHPLNTLFSSHWSKRKKADLITTGISESRFCHTRPRRTTESSIKTGHQNLWFQSFTPLRGHLVFFLGFLYRCILSYCKLQSGEESHKFLGSHSSCSRFSELSTRLWAFLSCSVPLKLSLLFSWACPEFFLISSG